MSWLQSIALGVGVGLAMEFIELIFHVGRFDVDDIQLNALGVIIGYLMHHLWTKYAQHLPIPVNEHSNV